MNLKQRKISHGFILFHPTFPDEAETKNMMGRRIRWTPEEDQVLAQIINEYGPKDWKKIAQVFEQTGNRGRTSRQVRDRWANILSPGRDTAPWTLEEELELFQGHKDLGNRWAKIAERLPGRGEYAVKNHFYAMVSRTVRRMSSRGKVADEEEERDLEKVAGNILHILQFNYSKRLQKLESLKESQPSLPSESFKDTIPAAKPPRIHLPSIHEMKAMLSFEEWGAHQDWKAGSEAVDRVQKRNVIEGVTLQFSFYSSTS